MFIVQEEIKGINNLYLVNLMKGQFALQQCLDPFVCDSRVWHYVLLMCKAEKLKYQNILQQVRSVSN